MVFRSRVSVFLLFFIVVSFVPAIWAVQADTTADPGETTTAFIIMGLCILLVVVLLLGMRYEIEENDLVIKLFGFKMGSMNIKEIISVKRSYNPLSSPAASLKRLYVKSKGKDFIISPVNEKEFVRVLKTRNPEIEFDITNNPAWYRFWDWDI